ncbi:MAG TPA: ATP-binding protein [Chloroflexia bacterium]|nr:ATP-binding protein [Chloroflexia bacterium]
MERLTRAPRWTRTWVRIALSYAVLVLLTTATLGLLLGDELTRHADDALQARLTDQAQAVGDLAAPLLSAAAPLTTTNQLAHTLSRQFGTQVTLVRPDGRVVGDSEEDPAPMENQSDRPEIAAALHDPGTPGSSRRLSATSHRSLLYVALAIPDPAGPGRLAGVARVAYPLTAIEQEQATLWRDLELAVLLVSVPAALLGTLLARSIVGPLSALRATAARLGLGDLAARAVPDAPGEIGELSTAFNTMAGQLSQTIRERTVERNQIAAVLAHMHDGVLVTDGAGTLVSLNPAAAHLFHLHPEQALHHSLVEITHSHELHHALRAALAQPGSRQRLEIASGSLQLAAVITAIPQAAPDGPTGLVVLQDISALRRLERVRRDFVANIGHELRTPLASIKLLVETLMTALDDDPAMAQDFLRRIDVEVDGLTQLVRELLELSKIESGQVALDRQATPVRPLLDRAAGRLQTQAARAGLTLTVQAAEPLPPVDVDATRVEQVLVNLVHNAIKFTPRGGQVTVGATLQPEGICITVADTGIGIPADDLPRIFERFYKVDKARAGARKREGGTGLGLAIAKHIVQAHGGRIWATSPRERGTTFYFTLPCATARPA